MQSLNHFGYGLIENVLDPSECDDVREQIDSVFASGDDATIESAGHVVGSRNLIDLWHGWQRIVEKSAVADLIRTAVGENAGLVRILFFNKPPGQGWSLSMHRDQSIAVKTHVEPAAPFSKPTLKGGVPHVVANDELLSRMLTLRLHLDAMHDGNGPLVVIPKSHATRDNDVAESTMNVIHCNAGDLFVMRPLLMHASRDREPGNTNHRRVIHLEIAPDPNLPGEYTWHRFLPIKPLSS